jgi:hypothetical protein
VSGTTTARADVLSQPFLTWTVYSSSNYLSPVSHLSLNYGSVLVNTSWYFTVQVVNRSGSPLSIDQTTGLGQTPFFKAPLYCSGSPSTCYYRITFDPLVATTVPATATLYLNAHKRNCTACWHRSAPISVNGTAVAPATQTPRAGLVCQTCHISLKSFVPWQTKVQLKTNVFNGGTLQLLGHTQSLFQSPLNISSSASSILKHSSFGLTFAPLKNGEYAIFSKGFWAGFVKPPWNWDLDHWVEAFHIAHFIDAMLPD